MLVLAMVAGILASVFIARDAPELRAALEDSYERYARGKARLVPGVW